MPASQTGLALLDGLAHDLHHHLIGIATALVNLQTAMATAQTLQRDAHGCILRVSFHFLVVECTGNVDATGRANHKLSPSLGIQVQQDIALQHVLRKVVGSKHTSFLIGSNQCLHRAMLQVFCLHDREDGCHAQAVVGTQRSALCLHPLTVNPRLDRISHEVVRRLGSFLWNHVHVGLQDHTLTVFHSGCGGLAHHHIATFVDECFHTCLLCEVEQELLYFLQMSARTRYLRKCIEVFPNALGIQFANFIHFL